MDSSENCKTHQEQAGKTHFTWFHMDYIGSSLLPMRFVLVPGQGTGYVTCV